MTTLFHRTTILGAGLLGGSLGMALHRRGLTGGIRVWSPSPSTREACAGQVWCGRVLDSAGEACAGADLVILCGPVDRIPGLLEEIAPHCEEDCTVTDVGSTKGEICRAGDRCFPADHPASFLGSHPMAGSEKSGLSHARADLFESRTCIVTPTGSSPGTTANRLQELWEKVGMKVLRCSPEEHDRMVARVSHLPHAVAAVLAATLDGGSPQENLCAGTGLRDTTRIAAGDPHLWEAILSQNKGFVQEALTHFETELSDFRRALDNGGEDLRKFLGRARDFRRSLDREDASP